MFVSWDHMLQTGRTSMVPLLAPGQRAAQVSAASRSAGASNEVEAAQLFFAFQA